jgi:hypothetical protein
MSHVLVVRMDGFAGRGTRPGSAPQSHVLVARMDGCGPASPAAGPVLAPLRPAQSPRGEYRVSEVYWGGHGNRTPWAWAAWRVQYGS